ncbi:MAG: methyltransferase domain-containing protein [Balneolaceae bacterium]|nr:methyltransferase domain-containing protein [Balneolaceae bacterium]
MNILSRLRSASLLACTAFLLAAGAASCQDASSDVRWLIDVLELKQGSVVADVGAGDGDQTLQVAHHVGPEGRVFSTELGEESVAELREEIEEAGLENVTVLEGHPLRTNLPEACCQAIYMRRVYHHITDPPAFNRSLFVSLQPGGRLAIIEFTPRGEEAEAGGRASGSSHGVTAQTVIKEVTAAGFELVDDKRTSGRDVYLVFRKPAEEEQD